MTLYDDSTAPELDSANPVSAENEPNASFQRGAGAQHS